MHDEEEESIPVSLPYELPTCYKWEQHATFYHPMMCGSIDGTDVVPHDRAIVRAMRAKYKPNKQVIFFWDNLLINIVGKYFCPEHGMS